MLTISRRAFMEGAGTLPAVTVHGAAPSNGNTGRGKSSLRHGLIPSRILLGGAAALVEDGPLTAAIRMFPAAFDAFEIRSRTSSTAALWALASHGNGLACAPCWEMLNAVIDGLPLVSVAQMSAGQNRVAMVSNRDDAVIDDLQGASISIRNALDQRSWVALARLRGWRAPITVLSPGGDPERLIEAGVARAALVGICERMLLERRGAPVRFIELPGFERMPTFCVAAHRGSLLHPASARSISVVLRALACADLSAVAAPGPASRESERRTDRTFGCHDDPAWRSLLHHVQGARAGTAVPQTPVWSDAYLPKMTSRRPPVLDRLAFASSA